MERGKNMRLHVDNFEVTDTTVSADCEVVITGHMSKHDTREVYGEAVMRRELEIGRSRPTVHLNWIPNEWKTKIEKVIFNPPATIVLWSDGTKTIVHCGDGDVYDKEKGLALCYMKKVLGNKSGDFNKTLKRWLE